VVLYRRAPAEIGTKLERLVGLPGWTWKGKNLGKIGVQSERGTYNGLRRQALTSELYESRRREGHHAGVHQARCSKGDSSAAPYRIHLRGREDSPRLLRKLTSGYKNALFSLRTKAWFDDEKMTLKVATLADPLPQSRRVSLNNKKRYPDVKREGRGGQASPKKMPSRHTG